MRVPVPIILAVKVKTPVPVKVKLLTFTVAVNAEADHAVEPKSNLLNQLPVVITINELPVVNVKFGAFVDVPPVVPNV